VERRKPLQAKTGLKRGSPLKTKKPLSSAQGLGGKKTIKKRSAKMSAIYKERRVFVEKFLIDNPYCQAHWDNDCTFGAVDVHEVLPRSQGGKIVGGKKNNYMAVCRTCHTKITDNPQEAHDRGFRKWSWEDED
jgi:hypothetical protein